MDISGGNPDDYGDGSMAASEADGPFVQERSDFSALEAFYAAGDNNAVFIRKLGELKRIYSHMRIIRGDGNCFYRAYMFAILESLLKNPAGAKAFKEQLAAYFNKLTGQHGLGYQADAIEMFYDDALGPVDEIIAGTYTAERLVEDFREYAKSNSIVFFARLVCSCYLQREEDQFAPFLIGEGLSVKDFVRTEVEPLDKEVEQLQIIALCQALSVPIRIEYLDRSEGEVNHHDFPDGASPVIFMLYRPGHYDLLYR